jgi:hypothetical protein
MDLLSAELPPAKNYRVPVIGLGVDETGELPLFRARGGAFQPVGDRVPAMIGRRCGDQNQVATRGIEFAQAGINIVCVVSRVGSGSCTSSGVRA